MKLERISHSTSHSIRFLVRDDAACPVGLVEKIKSNGDGSIHPWKAFLGIGALCKIIGFFYAEDGGREAAVNAVLKGVA